MNIKKLLYIIASVALLTTLSSCSGRVDKLIEEGKYKEAEKLIKNMTGNKKYEYAEALINEYIELEEYDRAVGVYENCTPEHCASDDLNYPSLYCHGINYELKVTSLFRKVFMETGDYDKVWQYSIWESNDDSGYNAEAYYKFMSDVILYLCSTGNKVEANRFLKHYVFWFDVKIDNNSYYSKEKPEFLCEAVRGRLQRLINTY